MTARIDINELARRENEQTEWKENVADIDDVVATLCAFANDLQNLGGGYVVCGAREDKDAHGFPRLVRAGLTANRLKEVENTVLARCRERVSPPIAPMVEELESSDPRARSVTPRWRNQALAWFLARLQLAQAEGQGIQTIRSTMKAAGCPPPIFEASEASVTCVLKAHPRLEAAMQRKPSSHSRPGKRARPAKAKPKTRSVAKPKTSTRRRGQRG